MKEKGKEKEEEKEEEEGEKGEKALRWRKAKCLEKQTRFNRENDGFV